MKCRKNINTLSPLYIISMRQLSSLFSTLSFLDLSFIIFHNLILFCSVFPSFLFLHFPTFSLPIFFQSLSPFEPLSCTLSICSYHLFLSMYIIDFSLYTIAPSQISFHRAELPMGKINLKLISSSNEDKTISTRTAMNG